MEPLSIVVNLDVVEHLRLGLRARGEAFAVHGFDFQAVVPAFHRGVVVAIALGAHAGHESVFVEQRAVVVRTILAATIGMHDHATRSLAPEQGHAQCVAHHVAVIRSDSDQPTTRREYKSSTTARYSQPSSVQM